MIQKTATTLRVIFVALLSRFGESRERTSWVISLNMSLAILLGPLWGLLTKVLSLRTQALLGCLIVGVSSVLCYFARSVTTVIILQGICGGTLRSYVPVRIGQGIVMPSKELLIGYHFRRHRGSANGICLIGGTLAAFVYPMILLLLIQEYNLGGALLITGGLQLHALAGSLFYRKPLWAQVQNGTEARRNSARLKPRGDDVNYMKGHEVSNMQEAPHAADMGHVSMSIIRPGSRKLAPYRNGDVMDAADGAEEDVREKGQCGSNLLHNCTDHKNRETNGSSASASAAVALLSNETGNAVEDKATATYVFQKHEVRWTSSAGARDLGFLKYPVFYMILATCSFSAFSMVTFTILVDYAKERNFSAQDGAILLSVKAIGDAISHPMSGLLPGRGLIDRRTLMCASQLTMAFSCALLPLAAHSYPALLVLCVLLGWSTSTVVVLFVPIMADRVGMASLGMSMGICRFAMGVGPLTCPLLIAAWRKENSTRRRHQVLCSARCSTRRTSRKAKPWSLVELSDQENAAHQSRLPAHISELSKQTQASVARVRTPGAMGGCSAQLATGFTAPDTPSVPVALHSRWTCLRGLRGSQGSPRSSSPRTPFVVALLGEPFETNGAGKSVYGRYTDACFPLVYTSEACLRRHRVLRKRVSEPRRVARPKDAASQGALRFEQDNGAKGVGSSELHEQMPASPKRSVSGVLCDVVHVREMVRAKKKTHGWTTGTRQALEH
ncbi:hypothetical protein HPB51_019743 [Rhipicephalus microplus]|uniref:Monocarboxylate transporter n=1 Tax=Rhipicephalus microplus TaxID=6941 RepID=A0A9J6F5D5_RHIMP|nr:hypothetical protein HPB51_019743 [Rhipicephalus microplus]